MEKSTNVWIVCLVLGLLIGESKASFKHCYSNCFLSCLVSGKNFPGCAVLCLGDCVFPTDDSSRNHVDEAKKLCLLDCASSSCTHFSTKENPAEEEVERCVDSCSEKCSASKN